MITGALITFVLVFFTFLVELLPASSGLPPQIQSGLASVISSALSWEYFFPVSTALTCIFLFLAWEFIIYTWHGLRYMLHFVRGTGA